jgi:TetR/AcrR family transcriptional repressor of nem operon
MPRKTDKRIRLIEAAMVLIHQHGFNLTTLAYIAQEADVPLGNVYYYFKTKEAIGEAVIERHAGWYTERLSKLNDIADPMMRLFAFMESTPEELDRTARYGCAIGGLCQELGKQGGSLADQAAKLLHDVVEWSATQFKALGFSEASHDLATHYIAAIQGMYLLTHTFKDPKITHRESAVIKTWLKQLKPVSDKSVMQQTALEDAII